MASRENNESKPDERPAKLKLTDKIWIAAVIAAFLVGFALILIYDIL